MTDQAENLRRLVRAQRDWKELTADEPPAPRPATAGGPVEPSNRPRDAGVGAVLGFRGGRKPRRNAP